MIINPHEFQAYCDHPEHTDFIFGPEFENFRHNKEEPKMFWTQYTCTACNKLLTTVYKNGIRKFYNKPGRFELFDTDSHFKLVKEALKKSSQPS